MTPSIPSLPLAGGGSIPQLGLGTWPLDDAEVEKAIVTAAEIGYRHVDTAVKYANEVGVGRGLARSGLAREDWFVTTKLDGTYQGDDRAVAGLDDSLARLGLDYVDLLLIHWPLPQRDQYVSTWQTFIRLRDAGKARAIGVSNFKPAHIDRLIAETGVTPAVNQIQLSPAIPRREQRAYDSEHGIVTESWSPIGGTGDLLAEPVLVRLAEKHGRTPGQIVLRWHVQNGLVAIPKSRNPERMAENLSVFDFELDADDLSALDTLDEGPDAGVDSDRSGH
ncbi:2,5-diketo-D-gluconate reductase A [Leifsonia sp. 98AMF]|uniref:aldo/keto reductase n=1 Tax=unclassified Leifsonia TaxID=2663824 RepID=UPI00087A822F|nr:MULTISPECIES: aldo/keto reductase [unclassified Leifsonia]SDH02485.1 2,5-diketo-D-gluconate reductase A [Leifsonia sp. 197AMF]SDJ38912.1 2,5-diketo-D-gluconate reductase A [Leifsonia sp. 466MF]SDK39856.1 2,5-diketo-D-gluconate reductase A [Leifsonia sp. 157MF]SDN59142.1 2,5-diketo-D-gluconate reductase A [Leifsonia sp. 509MF]SEN50159.1 2,5-diketo-D-gluconate reductase A [Leifsonia sp. 467MF]